MGKTVTLIKKHTIRTAVLSITVLLGVYILTFSPSLSRYWTLLVFFLAIFIDLSLLTYMLLKRRTKNIRPLLRAVAACVPASVFVYCMALSSLGQLKVIDVFISMGVGLMTEWFLLNPRNQV